MYNISISRGHVKFRIFLGSCIALAATFAVGSYSLAESSVDTTLSLSDLQSSAAAFNCNAGNAGNASRLNDGEPANAGSLGELASQMSTRLNGERALHIQMVAVRLRDGRVVAKGESPSLLLRPGEEIVSFDWGRETMGFWTGEKAAEILRLNSDTRVAKDGVRFVQEHVPVLELMSAILSGKGDLILRLMGATALRDGDVLLFAPVPEEWEEISNFTVHPTLVKLRY